MSGDGITRILRTIHDSYENDIARLEKLVDDEKLDKEAALSRLEWLKKLGVGKQAKQNKVTANSEKPVSVPVPIPTRAELLDRLNKLKEQLKDNPAALQQLNNEINEVLKSN